MSNNPTVRLQYIVDQASVTKTRQALNEVVRNLQAIGGQAAKDSETIKRFQAEISQLDRLAAIGRLVKQMFEFSQETGDTLDVIQKLRDTLAEVGTSDDEINDATTAFRRLAQAADEAKKSAEGVAGVRLGSDVTGKASKVSGAVGNVLGGIGGGASQFVNDTLGAVKALSGLGDTVSQLAPSAGGLAGKLGALAGQGIGALATAATTAIPALALFAIGITAIQAAQEKAVAAFAGATEGYRKAAALVATGSEETVRTEIRAAQERIKAAEATKQAAENVKRGIDEALGPAAGLVGAIYGYGSALDANNQAIKEADKTISENRQLVAQLERALASGQVATKTAAELEAELKRRREELNAASAAALNNAIAREIEYAELLRTGSSEGLKERIASLKTERDVVRAFLQSLTGALTEGEQKVVAAQKERLAELERSIARLSGPISAGVTAREREEQAIRAGIDALNENTQRQLRTTELIRSSTTQQIAARQSAIEVERAALEKQLTALRELPSTNERVAKETERVKGRLAELAREAEILSDVLPSVKLRELGEELKRGVEEAAKKVQDALAKQRAEIIGAVGKYDQDVTRIEEDALRRRADIQKNYNDALIAAAKRAADDATKALERLSERRANLARNLGRAETEASERFQERRLNAQIEYQRREVQAEQERVRRLEDIRRDAQRREFDLALKRDFAGLFASRLDTTRAIEDTNLDFQRGQRDRAAEFAQRQADAARAFEVERQQRLAKYQQDLADAQAQYERERALIAQQRAQALAEAQANRARASAEERSAYQRQLAARREALNAELKMIADFGRERVRLEGELFRRGLEIIRGLGAGAGGGVVRRATGGPLQAGQAALVNDGYAGQRERFNGAMLPSGLGVFIPARSGTVSAGGAPSIDLTFNVTGGNDPNATAQAIRATVEGVLKEYFT